MNTENSTPADELLSAYLDGELTAEDRAEVEDRLAKDPQARKTLDELRQLSSTVRALPAEGLGYDLKQRVLEQIGGEQIAQSAPATSTLDTADHGAGRRRGFAWAGLAIAATLMLMFFALPDREVHQPVAGVDKVKEANPAKESNPAKQSSPATPSSELSLQAASEGGEVLHAAPPAPVRSRSISPDTFLGELVADGERASGEEDSIAEIVGSGQNSQAQEMLSKSTPVRPGQGQRVLAELADDKTELAAMPQEESPRDESLDLDSVERDASAEGRTSQGRFSQDRAVDAVELVYDGRSQEALAQLETLFTQQGVSLRVASAEQLQRLQEGASLRDLSRLDEANFQPVEDQSGKAQSKLRATKKETEKPSKQDGVTAEQGLFVEATPEEIVHVLKNWPVVQRGAQTSSARSAGTRTYGEYGGAAQGYGGEYGGGGYGGGYGGRRANGNMKSKQSNGDEQKTSWAVRLEMSPEQWRRTSELEESVKAKAGEVEEQLSISEAKATPKRVRVFFYFRESDTKAP